MKRTVLTVLRVRQPNYFSCAAIIHFINIFMGTNQPNIDLFKEHLGKKSHLFSYMLTLALFLFTCRLSRAEAARRRCEPDPGSASLHPLHVSETRRLQQRRPEGPHAAHLHHQQHQEDPEGLCAP